LSKPDLRQGGESFWRWSPLFEDESVALLDRRGFRFDATDLHSYFESIGEEFSEQSWYSDLTSFAGLGEDPYPSVVDILGALTGGELMNGTEEDFLPIEKLIS